AVFVVKWALVGAILVPVAEVAAFIAVAMAIGWFPTLVLFVATSAAGILVLKRAGRGDLDRLRAAVSAGGIRTIHLDTPGLAPILAGVLLLLPGFFTDLPGALFLIPPGRRRGGGRICRPLRRPRATRRPSVDEPA